MSSKDNISSYIRTIRGGTKTLNLCGRRLKEVPKPICLIQSLVVLELKNNQITQLPQCLSQLVHIESLNLGNNLLTNLPEVLSHFRSLTKLNLFHNRISHVDATIFGSLSSLTFLNLNKNQIKSLPSTIKELENLQVISICHNQLKELPAEICYLSNLTEIRATHNLIENLPQEISQLENIKKLYFTRNKLKELPEGITKLNHLSVLDVAGNELRIFPTEIEEMSLQELYCEANPLLTEAPVHSVQEEEVLSLKEIAARFIMKDIKEKSSILRGQLRVYPDVREMLSPASKCAVCENAFLNTWLECVKFTESNQINISSCSQAVVPVRALLCSYRCFNTEGHGFYGVAFP